MVRDAVPREVYDVVVDFEAYPRLFPEFKSVRVLDRRSSMVRAEFRVEVVLAVRYVLDLKCDPDALTVDWTYVEGEIVVDSTGGWRFAAASAGLPLPSTSNASRITRSGWAVASDGMAAPAGTKVDYRASILIKAPLPGFIVRKATDALVAASIPSMFASIDREVRRRRSTRETTAP